MNRPPAPAILRVLTLTEKSILLAGLRNSLSSTGRDRPRSCLLAQTDPPHSDSPIGAPSPSAWPRTPFTGDGGLSFSWSCSGVRQPRYFSHRRTESQEGFVQQSSKSPRSQLLHALTPQSRRPTQ